MRITVPASSANLGPGFDALGLALDLPMELELGAHTLPAADETHPAVRAFRAGGGEGPLGIKTSIPPGRGLGFSGTAKVGGFALAVVQAGGDIDTDRDRIFALAAEREGHPDNAAPSAYGGLTVASAGRVVRVPVAEGLRVVVWIPEKETSTKASRGTLPETVPHADAVFNVGRVALLLASLTSGDFDSLAGATADRLHQPYRLPLVPETAAAIEIAHEAGALAAWLSGSGPTMAALVREADAPAVAAALPTTGAHVKILAIDTAGLAAVEDDGGPT